MLRALELEKEMLGEGVAWQPSRVRVWWDAGRLRSYSALVEDQLVGYASAARLDEDTFKAIIEGNLAPEHLGPPQGSGGDFFWVGIVLVVPDHQGRRIGAELLTNLCGEPGSYVADTYTTGGAKLVENLGWVRLRDGLHPLYGTVLGETNPPVR